jgi:phosphatidate cytidylyltransferase
VSSPAEAMRAAAMAPSADRSGLRARVISGVLMACVLLGMLIADIWFAPYYPLFALIALVVAARTSWELAQLLQLFPIEIRPWFCVLGGIAIPMSVWLAAFEWPTYVDLAGGHNPNFRPPASLFCACAMLAFLIESYGYRSPGKVTLVIAGHLVVFFYVGILGSFVVLLRWFGETPAEGTYILIMTVFTAKFCDIGAFFAGRFFGKHKMAPLLSPGKTIEGAIGGLLTATAFGTLALLVGHAFHWQTSLPWYAGAIFGLVVGWAAQIGDLMESLLKRDCRTKDAGHSIPGFGGVLDVVDSVFFSAPVAYLLLSIGNAITRHHS